MKKKSLKFNSHNHSIKKKARKQDQNAHLEDFSFKNSWTESKRNTLTTNDCQKTRAKNLEQARSSVKDATNFRWSRHDGIGPFFIDVQDAHQPPPPPDRPDYDYNKGEEERKYCYGFTDSQFLSFLGNMAPKSYLVFVTLTGVLITENLNHNEMRIIYAFISNVADTIQTIFEQSVILNNYQVTKATRDLNNALHKDLTNLYNEIEHIKKHCCHD